MNIKFLDITLQCKKSREVISFSTNISYFHGQISSGKSSLMRLVDFCLGGRLELTPALAQELISVELSAIIGSNRVLFERVAGSSNQVQVTWQQEDGKSATVLAPVKPTSKPIWNKKIFNLSDLIFHLAGIKPIRVRKSKKSSSSELVRLSFRDLMWYCYLEQDYLDSSFYRLEDPFRKLKSRDAMRYVTGYYTERMNDLEVELDEVRGQRLARVEGAKQIRTFLLEEYGYDFDIEVTKDIQETEAYLDQAKAERADSQKLFATDTHFADDLRSRLREYSKELATEEEVLSDLMSRIEEQRELKAELTSAKFKLARATSVSDILAGVKFDLCPQCGISIRGHHDPSETSCNLCGQKKDIQEKADPRIVGSTQLDLTSRIEDLDESIKRHTKSAKIQERRVKELMEVKSALDMQLNDALAEYDPAFLARAKEIERRVATLEERTRGLKKTAQILSSLNELESQASILEAREKELALEIAAEHKMLSSADARVDEIEAAYLSALLKVEVPGINPEDKITISRKTWLPEIVTRDGDKYSFYNAGSGGKKTLLNVCYALAVHRVAAENDLPLPTFLMIDTPMKNIGEDVNENIFEAFYTYLYELAAGPLSNTQLIIIDKEFFEPPSGFDLDVQIKYMSPNDHPLVSYYRGP